ncbi:MAG: epoxyqueuosine reductase QueH [Lachnospiraceae bacterium]|nr:epoxyqueuosine reductase QueH [Lachnospiraceae bacterium]
MKNNVNFQQKLDEKLVEITSEQETPNLLLHACCAPCSSYVLEYLAQFFRITVFFYNPNISPQEEFDKRVLELERFITEFPVVHPVQLEVGEYHPEVFLNMAKGLEQEPEGGSRCYRCYEQRLEETAKKCRKEGYDYFTTTLSISPYKNAQWLNEIGERMADRYGIAYLVSDFKKKNGYRRSIELSQEYQLYRQDYCGCTYSKAERERMKQNKNK